MVGWVFGTVVRGKDVEADFDLEFAIEESDDEVVDAKVSADTQIVIGTFLSMASASRESD